MWKTYYTLIETLKTQSPKVIVLECRSVFHYEDHQELEKQSRNISGFRLSFNKINAVMRCSPFELWDDMILELPLFHDRVIGLTEQDYNYAFRGGDENEKGFFPLGKEIGGEVHGFTTRTCEETIPLSEKTELYVRKIIEKCEEEGICLIMVQNPCPAVYDDPRFNRIREIAADYNVPYINFNLPENDIGIVDDDFHDDSHLNADGARKFTHAFVKMLYEYVDLPDHRGDPRFKSWDVAASRARSVVIHSVNDLDGYMNELENDSFFVASVEYTGKEKEFSIRDYSSDAGWVYVGNEATNHTYEYNGHVFTADFQQEDRIFIRYDGNLENDLKKYARVLLVYDRNMDELIDVVSCYYDGNEKGLLSR